MKLRQYFDEPGVWYRQAEETMPLEESSLARIWKKVEDDNISFGIISDYHKPKSETEEDIKAAKKENLDSHKSLRETIRGMGYGYIELKGGYKYEGDKEYTLEKSFIVPNITKDKLLNLCKKFRQETVIYKDAKEFSLLNAEGGVELSFVKGGGKVNLQQGIEAVKEYFSALVKGAHRDRKFSFKLMEHELIQNHIHAIGLDKRGKGTMALRWWNIYETNC